MKFRPFTLAALPFAMSAMLVACSGEQEQPSNPRLSDPTAPPTQEQTPTPTQPVPPDTQGAQGAQGALPTGEVLRNNNTAQLQQQNEQLNELPHATAVMRPTAGNEAMGLISFLESPNNIAGARIVVQMSNLSPGPHGMHIHENGDCSAPDASSAGDHFNPHDMPHGGRTAPQRHTGDLGNITANESGIVEIDIDDSTISFEGEDSVLGKALVVHASGDDYMTQPSGNSGDPVACGVITPSETSSLPAAGDSLPSRY